MKTTTLIPISSLALLLLACADPSLSVAARGSVPSRRSERSSRTIRPLSAHEVTVAQTIDAIRKAMAREDYGEAWDLVIAHETDPLFGNFMPPVKAELLARRGAKGEALDLYLEIARDPEMGWSPDSRTLERPLLLAVELRRDEDADEIATQMLAHPAVGFYSDPGVRTPRSAGTPRERLAYAYLLIGGLDAMERPDRFVEYGRKARALLPDSVPVLVQLAYAYTHRNRGNDLATAATLFGRAYAKAQSAETRNEIKLIARGAGYDPDPKTPLRQPTIDYNSEAYRRS